VLAVSLHLRDRIDDGPDDADRVAGAVPAGYPWSDQLKAVIYAAYSVTQRA